MSEHRRFSVVVGSGGIKPIAAIPFFHFLEEHRLSPELMIGCSGGAYVSAFWNAGYKGDALLKLVDAFKDHVVNRRMFSKLNLKTLLAAGNYPFGSFSKDSGILRSEGILEFYREVLGLRNIEDLEIPFLIYATDLDTGEPVVLDKGRLVESVYASGSLFPVLPPIQIDGRWLVDGGYHNGVPILEAIKRDSDVIVVLIFEEQQETNKKYRGFLEFFCHVVGQVAIENSRNQIPLSVHLHHSEVIFLRYFFKKPIAIWDVDALPEVLELGRNVLEQHKEELLSILLGKKKS